MDASIVLYQSAPFQMGTWFPTENGSPVAILYFKAVEAVHCCQEKLRKDVLWKSYGRKEVSITVYINIKSYSLAPIKEALVLITCDVM